jgi:hypothetical protein
MLRQYRMFNYRFRIMDLIDPIHHRHRSSPQDSCWYTTTEVMINLVQLPGLCVNEARFQGILAFEGEVA